MSRGGGEPHTNRPEFAPCESAGTGIRFNHGRESSVFILSSLLDAPNTQASINRLIARNAFMSASSLITIPDGDLSALDDNPGISVETVKTMACRLPPNLHASEGRAKRRRSESA